MEKIFKLTTRKEYERQERIDWEMERNVFSKNGKQIYWNFTGSLGQCPNILGSQIFSKPFDQAGIPNSPSENELNCKDIGWTILLLYVKSRTHCYYHCYWKIQLELFLHVGKSPWWICGKPRRLKISAKGLHTINDIHRTIKISKTTATSLWLKPYLFWTCITYSNKQGFDHCAMTNIRLSPSCPLWILLQTMKYTFVSHLCKISQGHPWTFI